MEKHRGMQDPPACVRTRTPLPPQLRLLLGARPLLLRHCGGPSAPLRSPALWCFSVCRFRSAGGLLDKTVTGMSLNVRRLGCSCGTFWPPAWGFPERSMGPQGCWSSPKCRQAKPVRTSFAWGRFRTGTGSRPVSRVQFVCFLYNFTPLVEGGCVSG